MKIAKWEPEKEFISFRKALNDLFNDFFGTEPSIGFERQFHPSLDISEDKNSFIVSLEVPGMENKDLNITIEEGNLIIKGEKKREVEEKDRRHLRVERCYGEFTRVVSLPPTVDINNVKATCKNGVLTIRLQKKEESKAKTITIE